MSRVIRMGVASAGLALKEAGLLKPDGIITGTGYGCLEDTGAFLSKMIANKEQSLNPTPFIQSTHNSIGSQIGLLLQCMGYNQTYVQGAFSLESSLLDAMMLLKESSEKNLLVGGVDEITAISHTILSRFGLYHHGARQGEGAAYFLLSTRQQESTCALLKDLRMVYKPESADEVKQKLKGFLEDQLLVAADIDLVLLGKSGDWRYDEIGCVVARELWEENSIGTFKHLCGEYPTATGFAIWLGATILKKQRVPTTVGSGHPGRIKNILIYNPYFGKNHSLILLQAP